MLTHCLTVAKFRFTRPVASSPLPGQSFGTGSLDVDRSIRERKTRKTRRSADVAPLPAIFHHHRPTFFPATTNHSHSLPTQTPRENRIHRRHRKPNRLHNQLPLHRLILNFPTRLTLSLTINETPQPTTPITPGRSISSRRGCPTSRAQILKRPHILNHTPLIRNRIVNLSVRPKLPLRLRPVTAQHTEPIPRAHREPVTLVSPFIHLRNRHPLVLLHIVHFRRLYSILLIVMPPGDVHLRGTNGRAGEERSRRRHRLPSPPPPPNGGEVKNKHVSHRL